MAELDIGAHCSADQCKQLDFLPFTCERCSLIYCLQHRDPACHQCINKELCTNETKKIIAVKYTCTHEDCILSELVPVLCSLCNNQYCLQHRNPEEHRCPSLPERKQPKASTLQKKTALVVQKQTTKNKKSSKMSAKLALMKLKQSAIGHVAIPQSERIYLSVFVESLQNPGHALFVSNQWSLGKTIDIICDSLKIKNKNNTDTSLKLKLCSAESGLVLPSNKLVQEVINEQLIYNGSSIIIASLPTNANELKL